MPLDFKRKLEAWEKIKGGIGPRQCDESAAAEAPVETSRRDNFTEKKVYFITNCDVDHLNKVIAASFFF